MIASMDWSGIVGRYFRQSELMILEVIPSIESMTTALVTGGCGFIGRNLLQHLLDNTDWRTVSLDSLSYATDTTLTPFHPRIRHYYHDLRSPVPEALKEKIGEVQYFFNVASESHVDRSIDDPVPFIDNNVKLVCNALEYARELKPTAFFQISTDEVYGPAPEGYFFKEWDTLLPSNPYSASKAAQEMIAISYWRTYGVPCIITNTMNNFGDGQHREKYVPKCIRYLLEGRPVPVHGETIADKWVSGSRVWLHAINHADALLFLARNVKPTLFPATDRPDKYHIAGDEEISNLDMVYRLAALLGVEAKYEWSSWHDSRPGHDLRYALAGEKLRSAGWNPPLTIEESFRRTVEYYRKADVA